MKFDYQIIEEEPIGCFPNLAKTLIGQLQLSSKCYLSAIIRSDDSTTMTLYASSYSILSEGYVPLVYRHDDNPFINETNVLLKKLQEVLVQEACILPQQIIFMNLLEGD